MTFREDELLPLSGLQHYAYCPRQAALIHVERQWADNRHTVAGTVVHRRVHEASPRRERRGDLLIVRGLPLRSLRLGVAGVADVVEFLRVGGDDPLGVTVPGLRGRWRPVPVEYKRGKPKHHRADEIQLCAQAICLEEMLEVEVPEGALYYGKVRRRRLVRLGADLRSLVEDAAAGLRELVRGGRTPPAEAGPRCRGCSLVELCLPRRRRSRREASRYLERCVSKAMAEGGEN